MNNYTLHSIHAPFTHMKYNYNNLESLFHFYISIIWNLEKRYVYELILYSNGNFLKVLNTEALYLFITFISFDLSRRQLL